MISLAKADVLAVKNRDRAEAIRQANRVQVQVKIMTRPVRRRLAELDARSERISRELRDARMLPSNRSNQFAGWVA